MRLKNANVRMFGIDIPMEKNEQTGYFHKTIDLADGKYHYQFKIVTKSWFEQPPEPAPPDNHATAAGQTSPRSSNSILSRALTTFTDIVYVFVDPYATEVDERGSDDARKSVGVLNISNGTKVIGKSHERRRDASLFFATIGR